jgi:hypothetical protein
MSPATSWIVGGVCLALVAGAVFFLYCVAAEESGPDMYDVCYPPTELD